MPSTPDTYTHGHQDCVLRSHRWRTAENSASYLLPHLRSGLNLLDVGCGPGTLTIDLARKIAPGVTVGIDIAAEAIAAASAEAADTGIRNVSFETGDFRSADFGERSFDVVHAHQVLQHLREPIAALTDMRQLVRPGGLLAARDSDYSAMTWAPADDRLDRWREVYLAVTRRNGAEANAGRWLLQWALTAGLTNVAYTTSTWTFATAEERLWWAGLWADRTQASSFAEQAVNYGIATAQELKFIAEGWRNWAVQPGAVFVVLHGEIIAHC